MKLQLITLTGQKLDGEIYEVSLPTESGEIAIFSGHEPLVTLAVNGVIAVRREKGDTDDEREFYATNGGVVEVLDDVVKVLVDEADAAGEITVAEAQAALQRAQELRDKATSQVDINEAQALVNRQATRLKVAGLRRRHR